MSKYTAEDFANARFASSNDGTTAHRRHDGWVIRSEARWSDEELAKSGWVIVPTKPTMTRGQYEDATRNLNAGDRAIFSYALHIAGVEIPPAPEPTNAEKLADVYRDWYGGDEVPNSLIRFMDKAGVTAPEEK